MRSPWPLTMRSNRWVWSRLSIQIVDVLNLFNRVSLYSVKFFNKRFLKNSFGWSGELSNFLNRTFSKFLIFRPKFRLWNSTFAVQTWKHKKAHRSSLSRSKLRPVTTACDSFLLKSKFIVFSWSSFLSRFLSFSIFPVLLRENFLSNVNLGETQPSSSL